MRIQRILVAAALLMLCAVAAYAQVSVSSTPVTTVIATGRAENAGALRISGTGVSVPVADTFTIRYGGLSITNAITTGVNISGTWAGCVIVGTADYVNGIVTINCPNNAATNLDYFTLNGVRLNIEGYAGANVVVSVGSLYNPVVAGQNTAVVINSIGAGLSAGSTGGKDQITATYTADKIAVAGYAAANWTLTEGFASAWASTTQAGPGAVNGTDIVLTCTGLGTGVTLNIANNAAVTSGTITYTIAPTALTPTVTQAVLSLTGTTSQSAIEKIGLAITPAFSSSPSTQAVASYLIYASLSPIQIALKSSGSLPDAPVSAPRFAEAKLPTAGFTVLQITPNTTSFIIPYVTTALGYDTGIALANTSTDPFANGGAKKMNGSVVVTFYGNDGTTVTYDSAVDAAKGTGLTAGLLNSGSTWTVLASELLAAKARTTPLTGYAIVVLNALNGHGAAYVSNFTGFTSGSPMLVLYNPAVNARTVLTLGAEVTSH